MHRTGKQTLYMSSSVYKPKFHFPQWTAWKGKMQKFEFYLQRPWASEKSERTDSRICYSIMAFWDLHLTFEEHTNTINADVLLQMWLSVLVSKQYERCQEHLNGLVIQSMPGCWGSGVMWFSHWVPFAGCFAYDQQATSWSVAWALR